MKDKIHPDQGRKPNPVDKHVGLKIREARILKAMSQVALAQQIGVSINQVQKYESAGDRISAGRLYDVSAALKTDIRFFFDGLVSGDDGTATSGCMVGGFQAEDLKITGLLARIDNRAVKQPITQLLKAIAGTT